jgi:anti-sigma28 factor (negative regulator of flagellin synthesis)
MISNVKAGLLVANQVLNTDGGKIQKELKSEKTEKTEKTAELKKVDSIKEMISNGDYAIDIPAVSTKMADALLEGSKNN